MPRVGAAVLVIHAVTPDPSPFTPVRFGKYTLVDRIAVGGMAEVFLAVSPGVEGFEKTVALKRIRPHLTAEDSFIRMFLSEAKLAALLQHPNIVQIYDLGKIADSYFIAMEYVSGRDMAKVVSRARKLGIVYPVEYALFVAAEVLEALAYAHDKTDEHGVPLGIVHRDVTPENIIVGWNGHVRLADFGIAKAASRTDPTNAGEIKGKLSYMSPEQGRGKTLDHRSDLFTLGVVLYEWLTGYKLFTGENEMAVLSSILDGRIYPPTYFREDVPAGVEDLVMKALTKDREARYGSARDMLYDVQTWLQTGADFVPSRNHLANFMGQMFATEIERERRQLAAVGKDRLRGDPPPLPDDDSLDFTPAITVALVPDGSGDLDPDPTEAPALIVIDGERSPGEPVRVHLTPDELDRLHGAAERAGETVESVVQAILRATLRYL